MIPVQNIYYMLSYAFRTLQAQEYQNLATEPFHNTADLCAAILSKGISGQLKRGLERDYIEQTNALSTPRGRIDSSSSLKTCSLLRRQLVCTYDDFSENSYMNRILKTTLMLLMHANIAPKRKKDLRRVLLYFANVEMLDLQKIQWHLRYHRNNQTYYMLISICYLVVKGLIQTNEDGTTRLMTYLDDQRMCRLYEKFIFAYFQKEFPQISVSSAQIAWALDDGMGPMLPIMLSDVMLRYREKVLIIDAKYYTHILQTQYDRQTWHSNNLYQIFAYVKNKDAEMVKEPREVSGMLLYAGTDENVQAHHTYQMSGNVICVRTLDLNCNFDKISAQLNQIVEEFFGIIT